MTVPKVVFDGLGLKEGHFVEVNREGSNILCQDATPSSGLPA
jgi:bifunctional DNA-binding transcriptional regulator/antitoxin component of YhaV-PrlF toxin-antitoxin module